MVGDDDQSIYKFRGADINNILDFEKYFNDAKIIKLERNYRSTQKILDVANEVIKNNAGRKDKRLWTSVKDGTKVIFNVYENGYEEARGIAEDIAHRHLHDGKDYSDFAILYRTNAQSRSLEEKLIEKNIPYRIYGGINFYARREIKDILAYLKTIDNARDDLAVKRILNVPKRGIGTASVEKVDDYAYENDITFYVALRQAKEVPGLQRAVSKVEGFVTQIEVLKSKSQYIGVGKLIEEIIETVGYSDYIDAESESDEQATERRQNIDELISKAVQYEETMDEPSLSGFLEEVALVADIDNLDENNDMVSLMTIHSAKGLEFPIVYLAGMEDGLFPSYMSISTGDESDIEEERRLCYVGITRAKETLIMSAARMRTVRGEIQMNRTSRFVREIPKELLAESAQMLKKHSEYSSITGKDHMELPVRKRGQVAFNSYQRETISNTVFDKKTDSAPDYVVGDRVRHIKFGEGTVADMINGGRDYEVTVDFDTAGRKKMFAGFAKLVKI